MIETNQISDDARLADLISAAVKKEQAGQAHGLIARTLKKQLAEHRRHTLQNFARGDRAAQRLSQSVDVALNALFETIRQNSEAFAICPVGGFGRSQLAPYSDVDLLFLHKEGARYEVKPILDAFLYPLWDSGLKIGYSVQSPASATAFAREDMIARTAFLDARYLCGDRSLYDDFWKRYEKLRKGTKTQFIKAKLKEQAERQTRAGETRYLTEPDIKEGKGGLRDLQTIRWIYKYVYGGEVEENADIAKVIGAAAQRDLRKAERFLWSVRAHLHDLKGRADERLTFDIQPGVAARLGYSDRSNMSAAERLMKHYFLTSVDVGRLTRILCAKLEEQRTMRLPRIPKLLPRILQSDEAPGKPNLKIHNGRLAFRSNKYARRRPRDLFRLFRAFSKRPKIDFHPDALALVSEQAASVTSDIRKDPVIAKLFLAILTQSESPERALRIMAETGLLGKYIPAFGSIMGRIYYGLYRQFTLDEHVLRSVAHLDDIARGRFKADHPIATRILNDTDSIESFYTAVFLHEARWSLKDKSVEPCERLVIRISKRFGFDPVEARRIGWACARHLLMVRTAERRNLADDRVIANFAEEVGDEARLDMLLVLSVCYLRIVGHHSWDEFTRRQLTELYTATRAWMAGGEAALAARTARRIKAARFETAERLVHWTRRDREQFLSRLTDSILCCVDPDLIIRFATLIRAAERDGARAAVTVTPRDGSLEAIVYGQDRVGLLGDLAAAAAAEGVSVRSVQALTMDEETAIDIFTLQSPDGEPLDDAGKARRIHKSLLQAAHAAPQTPPALKRRFGDRREIFTVTPSVRVDGQASDDAVVVEAEGLDRPGLLYELASALTDMGLTISSAQIATYGERAVDVFYLNEANGEKITGKKRLKEIETRLLKVLIAGSGA